MGWLRDAMQQMDIPSFRQLAFQMEATGSWPKPCPLKNLQSLANKLAHWDEGKDVAWWHRKGEPFLQSLADVLGMTRDELLLQMKRADDSSADRIWQFNMFPALPPLDLRNDALPPGIPEQLTYDGGPRADLTWWHAPPGAGKTLVGRWLEHRFGWTRFVPSTWAAMCQALPQRGRAFVELSYSPRLDDIDETPLSPHLKLCIAAPFPFPRGREPEHGAPGFNGYPPRSRSTSAEEMPERRWSLVQTPPTETWLGPLIEWVAERVSPHGGFDAAGVHALFDDEALSAMFVTPGDLLGFLGLVDEVGLKAIDAPNPDLLRWVRVWLRAAIERNDRSVPSSVKGLLYERGADLLVQMASERMRRGLRAPLQAMQWADLAPKVIAPSLDTELLQQRISQRTNESLDEALAMLKPNGKDIVAGLENLSVLFSHSEKGLTLQPTWLRSIVDLAAFHDIFQSGPDGIGTLLAHAESSEQAFRTLRQKLLDGESSIVKDLVTGVDFTYAERVIGVDGAFRAIGFALAMDVEILPELVQQVWDAQVQLTVSRWENWPALPVISIGSLTPWQEFAAPRAWLFAAFSISAWLSENGIELPPSALVPWRGLPEDQQEYRRFESAIREATRAFEREEWHADELHLACFRLGSRLLDSVGIVRPFERLLEAQIPDIVVEMASGKTFEIGESELADLVKLRCGYEAIAAACERRGSDLDHVLRWCWQFWLSPRGDWPPFTWLQHRRGSAMPGVKALWRVVPPEQLSEDFCKRLEHLPEVWPWLSSGVWSRWFELRWSTDISISHEEFFWHSLPTDLILAALRAGHINWQHPKAIEALWTRAPNAISALVGELASTPMDSFPDGAHPLYQILSLAPVPRLAGLLKQASRWVQKPNAFPGVGGWLRRWLLQIIENRAEGWRDAYMLMLTGSRFGPNHA